jgi:hypothetical protein
VLQSDLTVQPGSAWLEAHPGTSVLHFVLINQGRRGAGPFEVDLDVTPDNADGGRIFVATVPGLGPGASVSLTAGPILPSDWLATGHFRGFVVVAPLERTTRGDSFPNYLHGKSIEIDLVL